MITFIGGYMLIKDALDTKTISKLLHFKSNLKTLNKKSYADVVKTHMWKKYASSTDTERKDYKGSYYANQIFHIRMMTKKQLLKYHRNINKQIGVKAARKVKKPFLYGKFDQRVKDKIELSSYAFNRMLTL
jgi:hypothetical protein